MEKKQLSWVLKLSLKDLAFRRIIVHLWNKTIILTLNRNLNLRSHCYYIINNVTEDMVKDDMLKLSLPECIKKKMMQLIKPIGLEILKWQIFHERILKPLCKTSYIRILKHLYWTSTGVIDYKKSAEEFMRLQILDVVKQYQLACLYCMVDYIPPLWKELPEENKEHFYDELNISVCGQAHLECYWAHILKGEMSKLDSLVPKWFGEASFHQYIFVVSARQGNKSATEYFFVKLTNGERDFSLFRTICFIIRIFKPISFSIQNNLLRGKPSDIIYYFLSKMTFEEQMEVLMQCPCKILGYFLQWPWQDLFLDVADVIWAFLPESSYYELLDEIAENIQHPGCYFPDLIQKFFQKSPSNFRNHFVNYECIMFCLFPGLFRAEDMVTIEVIFRMLEANDRARLISSYHFYELFNDLMMRNKWQLVERCLQKAMLSREDKESLKETFRKFLTSETDKMPSRRLQLERLFEFLDKMEGNNPVKRFLEEEKTTIKKLCSEK